MGHTKKIFKKKKKKKKKISKFNNAGTVKENVIIYF